MWAVEGFASYEGKSGFLRWWPKVLLAAALFVLVEGGLSAIQWATLFPFGRRLVLPKDKLTVRLENVGAVAVVEGHRRLGYLLHDGVLYVPGQQSRLRLALNYFGYRVV